MENLAAGDSIGYDQIRRWGEKNDYDCSSSIITAWEQAGVPVKTKGATYTGNMIPAFLTCGFKDITAEVDMTTSAGLKRGDVLLNTVYHTAMYCGNNMEVEASLNEKGIVTGGVPGYQNGKEILVRTYRNYPWTHILRYQETTRTMKDDYTYTVLTGDSLGLIARELGVIPIYLKKWNGLTSGLIHPNQILKLYYRKCMVTANNAVIRTGPHSTKKIIKKITKGTELYLCGSKTNSKGNKWYKIWVDGKMQYIYSKRVQKI